MLIDTEAVKLKLKQLTEENDRLKAYINNLHAVLHHLSTRNTKLESRIEETDKRIESLISLIDDLEREKWSIQSELENLRGY